MKIFGSSKLYKRPFYSEDEVFVKRKTSLQEPNLLIFIPVNRNEMQSKNELKQQSVILNDITYMSNKCLLKSLPEKTGYG